jgi:hypothetical protein
VFVNVIAVRMMEVPIMQVINVAIVLDSRVTAAGTVLVIVTFVYLAICHGLDPLSRKIAVQHK